MDLSQDKVDLDPVFHKYKTRGEKGIPPMESPSMLNLYGIYVDLKDDPFADLVRYEMRFIIRRALALLTLQQKTVIILRFGLVDGVEHTLQEIGDVLGVTRERIRHIESKALLIIKNRSKATLAKDFPVFQKVRLIND